MAVTGDKVTKRGYIRGVHGVLITPLDRLTGAVDATKEEQWVDTAQQAEAEAEYEEGETDNLRGGDRILAHIEEEDTLVAFTASFRNARYHPVVHEYVAGGSLVYDVAPNAQDILGWEAPTLEEQGTNGQPAFRAEVYAKNFNAAGKRDDFVKVTLHFCRGRLGGFALEDQSWATPEFEIRASGHPADGKLVRKEFVATADVPTGPTHDPA